MNDPSKQVITTTMMPEVEIDATTPGQLVPVKTKAPKTTSPTFNPLLPFLIFLPFIYLGAIAIILLTKLFQLSFKPRP